MVIDRKTGAVRPAQIFVAVLGASSYTYADATCSQEVQNFIASTVRAMEFFGGVARVTTPDNLKSAVLRTSRYEPRLNPAYLGMARPYGTDPTRQTEAAEGQGEGRSRRPTRGTVGAGAPKKPSVLLPGRTQRGDRRVD